MTKGEVLIQTLHELLLLDKADVAAEFAEMTAQLSGHHFGDDCAPGEAEQLLAAFRSEASGILTWAAKTGFLRRVRRRGDVTLDDHHAWPC
jgi:hypothetical protein